MKRKLICLSLSAFLAASGAMPAFAATSAVSFQDLQGNWAEEAALYCAEKGLMQGYNGNFRPADHLSRAEMAAVIVRSLGLTEETDLTAYSDIDASSWYYSDMSKAVAAGIFQGSGDKLNPGADITREEAFTVFARAYQLEADLSVLERFRDSDQISAWARDSVSAMVRKGWIEGSDGALKPKSPISRGELAQIFYNGGNNMTPSSGENPSSEVKPGTGQGGSSSGGSSGGGSGGTVTPVEESLVKESQTKIVDLGYAQYVSIAFEDGYSAENCTVTVDGTDVTSVLTPVTDDGSVTKWELTSLKPAKLTVTSGDRTQNVILSDNKDPQTPEVVSDTGADYFLTHGAVYVWDYYLTNYDAAGNVRVKPAKTTFGTSSQEQEIPFYSPDAVLVPDEEADNGYHVSGEAVVMFNYAEGTEAEKAWVDGISDVDLVAYGENNQTLNGELEWTLDKEAPHGDSTAAQVSVPLGQINFFSNGRYQLRITSGEQSRLFPIHVVNEKIPSMQLSDPSVESGKNVHFKIKDMTYGITMPIYRVQLTLPGGETEELDKIDDWYLFGDSFVLYNDNENHLTEAGNYTLTIWADGFQSFSKTFSVNGAGALFSENMKNGAGAAKPVSFQPDAVTMATSVGSGGSEDGSGGSMMSADLVFDADLLANAEILCEIGVENDYAKAIADRWEYDMSGIDAVYLQGSDVLYTASGYFDAVNEARAKDKYLTFAQYIETEGAETTQNRPYRVKQVLEDNLLGEAIAFDEAAGKEVADLILVDGQGEPAVSVKENTDPVFYCEDLAYLQAVGGHIYLNNDYLNPISEEDCVIDAEKNTMTLKGLVLTPGLHTLELRAPGYQTVRLTFQYEKVLEQNLSLSLSDMSVQPGDTITVTVSGSEGDFLKNLKSVVLNQPNGSTASIGPEGYYGYDEYYTLAEDYRSLTIVTGDSFRLAGQYSIQLQAEYYAESLTTEEFTVIAEEKTVPSGEISLDEERGLYQISFESAGSIYSWKSAIQSVTVNGESYTEAGMLSSPQSDSKTYRFSNSYGYDVLSLGGGSFKADENNEIIICAKGYQDFVIEYNENSGADNQGAEPPAVDKIETPFYGDYRNIIFEGGYTQSEYMDAITSVIVDGTEYQKVDYMSVYKGVYRVLPSDAQIHIGIEGLASGEHTVTVKASGYKDCTFTLTVN